MMPAMMTAATPDTLSAEAMMKELERRRTAGGEQEESEEEDAEVLIDDYLAGVQYAFFSMPFFVSTFVFGLKFLILKTFWLH